MTKQTLENFQTDLDFRSDVLTGLSADQKFIPSKYLYDERGSELFDRICELEEYYLTRTEQAIMLEHADAMADQIDAGVMLVEYGSGSSLKTQTLLDALHAPVAYVPVDISEEHLLKTAEKLRSNYHGMEVLPVVADFTEAFELPVCRRKPTHVALYFPGSTLGNFTPEQSGRLLQRMAEYLGPEGGLLIGLDLQKSPAVIHAAYNDSSGVTAEFSLNLLARINRELDADLDIDAFEHQAIYNSDEHRVEIGLVSLKEQTATIADETFSFAQGELIRTEYSYKYTVDGFARFAEQFGFKLHKYWTDDRDWFGVLHLVLEN